MESLLSKVGKQKLKLPIGDLFTKNKEEVRVSLLEIFTELDIKMLFSSPNNNITYLHYTRGRDLAVLQHQHDRRGDKLLLYAVIAGQQYNLAPCGRDCHLWIKIKARSSK